MDLYDLGCEAWIDTPDALECREIDADIQLGAGRWGDIAELLAYLEDDEELARHIAAVIKDRPGAPEEIHEEVFLSVRDLRWFLAEQMARRER